MEMNDAENIFDKLRELSGKIKGNFNILEDQVDINVQMEYFKYAKEVKKDLDAEAIIEKKDDLFNEVKAISEKKHLISQLASIDNVSAFRTIEKYLKNPDTILKDWALMAFQESKMLLESSLLDENQIFISTGLGGKGTKLRYFVVLFSNSDESFNDFQQRIIKNEFEFVLTKSDAEIEEISFKDNFASIMVLVPINSILQTIFENAIEISNEYGNFIKKDFIITNVKKLSKAEIVEFIEKNKISGISDQSTIDTIDDID